MMLHCVSVLSKMGFKLIQKPGGHLALVWYCVIESWQVQSENAAESQVWMGVIDHMCITVVRWWRHLNV